MAGAAAESYLDAHGQFERASTALVGELRQMARRVESRLADFQKEVKAPATSLYQSKRREKVLRDTAEGASAVESCLNDVCDQLEADAPPRILRERVQACEKNDVQYTKQLLCHLQGLGVDLEAMPSVVKWQDHQEHDLPDLQACSSAQDLRIEVERRFGQSPLAQHCVEEHSSSSAFDVAQSPAMGVLDAGVSAVEDKVQLRSEERQPQVKNWATLQEQNDKLAAILAQHNITLNIQRT